MNKPEAANVLITGGSGLIGRSIGQLLVNRGYSVSILSRTKREHGKFRFYQWNLGDAFIEPEAIQNANYIVHLAGENIGEKRWTHERKKQIIESRTESARLLHRYVAQYNPNLKAFITSSAIGYYGAITTDTIFKETDKAGTDFLGEICSKWEAAADAFQTDGIRTVKIRTGVVLTPQGGPLAKMVLPAKLGFGSGLGSGKQYLPWIHIHDLCQIFLKAIEDDQLKGIYNGVAPEHVTNNEFNRVLAKALKKPFWAPNVPTFVLKLIFGEMATIFLNGSRISSDKIRETGVEFQYPELSEALQNLLA
ncbi:MAG: TIGR01777 family oxidoreductase [Bacteroidia bacterium]|nr:TIGR01777 family oxidoreductase [Bacteroidia bacterium]